MNKQRKVLITTTYNEMGVIIDTRAEEVAQPNLQPTCNQLATDTISRQQAIDALDCINGVEEVLRSLPPVQPEPQEGEWIVGKDNHGLTCGHCSRCGMVNYAGKTNYCPNCGAKMT